MSDVPCWFCDGGDMVPDPDGMWVLYADHAAEVERLREAGLACADRVGDLLREAREGEEKHGKLRMLVSCLRARVQELEADPRMALTVEDLEDLVVHVLCQSDPDYWEKEYEIATRVGEALDAKEEEGDS